MFFTDYIDINTDNKQAVERPIAATAHHNPFLILKLNQRRSFRSLGFGSHSWFSCHGWLVCCLEGSRTLAQGRILVCLHVVSHFAEACIKEIRKVFRQMQVVKEWFLFHVLTNCLFASLLRSVSTHIVQATDCCYQDLQILI